MDWTRSDYVIALLLICGAYLLYKIFSYGATTKRARYIIAAAVLALLVLVWAQLAVGLVDLGPGLTGS